MARRLVLSLPPGWFRSCLPAWQFVFVKSLPRWQVSDESLQLADLGRCRMANAPTSRSSPAMPIRHRLAGLIAVAGRAGVLASSGIRGKKSGEQTNPLICQLPRYDSASSLRWFSARLLSGRFGHSAHLDRCSSRPCRWGSPCAFRGRPESDRRYRVKLSGGTCLFQFLRYPMNFTCWTTR